jgi:ABC-type glycerol-3-phosphate transport system permease component
MLNLRNLKKAMNIKALMIYTILTIFLIISVMPIVWFVLAGLKETSELNENPFSLPKAITFQNIIDAWTIGKMGDYFMNSVIVAVPRVFFVIVLSALAGYAFAKLKFPGREPLFYLLLFGMMVPLQAMIIPLYYTMQNLNLINSYWSMILPHFGMAMPFAIFLMRAFYRDIPNDMMEAARIDGCSDFKTFVHIMLPLIMPAVMVLVIFEFVNSWNDFLLPLLFVYDEAYRTLPLGLMYFSGEYTTNQSLVAAGVTIAVIPIVIVYIIFQRKFIEGITAGAVKG